MKWCRAEHPAATILSPQLKSIYVAQCKRTVLQDLELCKKVLRVLQELDAIAMATRRMAARDLKAICEEAEREWVSSIFRGQAAKGSLPPLSAYIAAAKARSSSLKINA